MKKEFAGRGRKRPQINIPLTNIELDNRNPRLAEEYQRGTQLDILSVLYNEFDLEEIAYSMAENGYFDEEPIVVIPAKLPKSFTWSEDVNKLQTDFEKLISESRDTKFIVIEGNRRIATARLLTNKELRIRLKIQDNDLPQIRIREIEEDLKVIPAIIYKDRKDISPYLGIRHITGVLRWEAYAKARYIATRIEEEIKKGRSIESSIKDVQRKIADRSDIIKKQYMAYKIFEQVRDDIQFDVGSIINRFSLITVILNYPSIREFIGVASYKDVKFNRPLVPKSKLAKLDTLFTWIFGKGKDKLPILTDSRKIQSQLSYILADKDATEYLLQYGNLEEAYERSGGEREYIKKKINNAKRAVSSALQYAYKYKGEKEIILLLKELKVATEELEKVLIK